MGAETKIQWTQATWSPVRGCSMAKGSETGGCLNCYAARMAARGLPGLKFPDGKVAARILDSGPRWTGRVELLPHLLDIPLRRRKSTLWFVNSLSDTFHEALKDEDIDRIFAVMQHSFSRGHRFQILTKRPERALRYFQDLYIYERWLLAVNAVRRRWSGLRTVPLSDPLHFRLPHVWLGFSAEDQRTFDERWEHMRQLAAMGWLVWCSYEPALGHVDMREALREGLRWVVCGGESGPGARPFNVDWAYQAVRDCKKAGVPCFIKQLGRVPFTHALLGKTIADRFVVGKCAGVDGNGVTLLLDHAKGGDWDEWPVGLRVRELPG